MPRLDGKIALVTGGAGGIGTAICEVFCSEGAKVAIVDCDGKAATELSSALNQRFGEGSAIAVQADVGRESDANLAINQVIGSFGHLTTLINNAGVREHSPIVDASAESWLHILQVNLVGAANCSRAALPSLRKSSGASIVNVSSTYAVVGRKGMGQYDATKAALLSLTRTMAWEEAAYGIRVNAVCPGGTSTRYNLRLHERAGRNAAEARIHPKDRCLIGRWAEPKEIAYPILWLVCDEASFITGSSIMVDGGTSAM